MFVAQTAPDTDTLTPLVDLARDTGVPYHTLHGWVKHGVGGCTLRVFRKGGRLYARPSWLADFLRRVNRD